MAWAGAGRGRKGARGLLLSVALSENNVAGAQSAAAAACLAAAGGGGRCGPRRHGVHISYIYIGKQGVRDECNAFVLHALR